MHNDLHGVQVGQSLEMPHSGRSCQDFIRDDASNGWCARKGCTDIAARSGNVGLLPQCAWGGNGGSERNR